MRISLLRSALPASLVALSLVLAGCGGGDDPKGGDGKEGSSQVAEPDEPAIWPLTGLEAPEGTSVELDRPVIVTKIDNTDSSSPQIGVGKADLIVEELVEGGSTRLAAFYYSQLPKDVGPVRSMRASDIGIVSPVDAVVTTSGAAQMTIDRINKAGIKFFQEGGPGFYRKDGRSAPYDLFTNLRKVANKASDDKDERPADYLPWGAAADLPDGQIARTLTADFGRHSTNWVFRNGHYVNKNSFAAQGDRFQPSSVLVLRVKVGDAGYSDPAGNFVPESKFEGTGTAMLFTGGKVIEGTWKKDKLDSAVSLATPAGELKVPAGKVWIELVPVDAKGGSVAYGK